MKQAIEWNPEPNELALVPGGPACRRYVAQLTDTEREAIKKGRKGYLPLFITVIATRELAYIHKGTGDRVDGFAYSQKSNLYHSNNGYACSGVAAIRRKMNADFGLGNYRLIATPDRMERMDGWVL